MKLLKGSSVQVIVNRETDISNGMECIVHDAHAYSCISEGKRG